MHVVNARADLNEEIEGSVLAKILFFPDEVKEVAFARVLESQVNCVLILKACIESANILVIKLFLNSDFTDQRLFYFTARQGSLLDFLDSDHDSGALVLCKLDFTVRAFTKVGISRLNEFKIFLGDVLEYALKFSLFWCQSALVIAILDKWRVCLDSLAF